MSIASDFFTAGVVVCAVGQLTSFGRAAGAVRDLYREEQSRLVLRIFQVPVPWLECLRPTERGECFVVVATDLYRGRQPLGSSDGHTAHFWD